jgi:hypothetical protein
LFLAACSSGNHIMTMQSFYDVPVGSTTEELIAGAGEPNRIHQASGGVEEYEYIERMKAGARTLQERHYFFKVQNGRVIEKRMEQVSPHPIYFDSYEMQTTQKDR